MKKLFVACIAILAAGCAPAHTPGENDIPISDGSASLTVKEVTLSDGTRCAVVVGYYKGGITCDWTGSKEPR